ncbi:MAG TPA: hypothetical protein QGG18_10385, partial [Rhodospirillales bacterium]|nr:hypothetical protein [Rhodospirillales bacterium]
PCENNTGACAARVRDALDVETGEEIDPDNLETLIVLAESIIISENGKQPYPPETIKAGALLALGRGAEIPPAQDVRSCLIPVPRSIPAEPFFPSFAGYTVVFEVISG